MEGAKKTLVYATRAFDPKDENLISSVRVSV